jgi:hypothetical protein
MIKITTIMELECERVTTGGPTGGGVEVERVQGR